MKHSLYIFFLLIFSTISIVAQEQNTTTIADDTNKVIPVDFNNALDSLLHDWYARNSQIGDCQKQFSFVTYPDSIYIQRLQNLPYLMKMPFNEPIKNFINFYANRPKQVEFMLGIGQEYYFPIFEQILEAYGVPMELKYLPVIESALNARATSRAGARGLWQFMVNTGKLYGLEINSLVDDRCDPLKATDAAARYLRDLNNIYNDWHLVIAAYNCGPGNVNKAISRAGGKRDYWDIYPYLPRETRSYVPIFIAANYIMNYYDEHNMCPLKPTIHTATDTIQISKRLHLLQVASVLGLPIDELRVLNPQYKHDIIPATETKSYTLVLPVKYINAFIENEKSIFDYKAEELTSQQAVAKVAQTDNTTASIHIVRSGDTLGGIAKKYHVTVAQLKKWNNLKGDTIRPKQKLRICR